MPNFSIILPTYNRAKLLERAIQSVIEQSYSDWELIVIDDGSTDNTKAIISNFDDRRIKYFYQENKGRSIARNKGIEKAIGDWICYLDSDDCYSNNHLEIFNNSIKSDSKPAVYKTGVQFVNENEEEIFKSLYLQENESRLKFFSLNYCSILDLCIHKNNAKTIMFENVSTWEDKAYILDLLKNNDIHQLHHRTVIAHEHSGRSVLKTHESPKEINKVLQLMSTKLTSHKASSQFITRVQQNFLFTVLIDARKVLKSTKSLNSLLSQLDIKPTWKTQLKLFVSKIFKQ